MFQKVKMSKLQLFRDFVYERLAAAALEIFGQYEKTLTECQEEIYRANEKSAELQRMLNIADTPEIKTRRTDVQQLSPLLIKEEREVWPSQGSEQLQWLPSSENTHSIFTSPQGKSHSDAEDLSRIPPLDQTPTVEESGRFANTTEEQIKAEFGSEDYVAMEPPHFRLLPTRMLKSSIKSRQTWARYSKPSASPRTSPRTNTSSWTRLAPSSPSGSESEDVSTTAKKTYQCEECDKAFLEKGSLVVHRRLHTGEKPYQCQECDKVFSQKAHLISHVRIHTGEKPYQCQDCDKGFSEKGSLAVHRRIHTGEKPYQCQVCGRGFSQKGHLVSHVRIHTGEKPYQCEECDNVFSQKNHLIIHRRIHTGEKPYQCGQCDKAFTCRGSLVTHRRFHTGERPYECVQCDKVFSQKGHLLSHERTHREEKPFQCEVCDKAYRMKSSLIKHRLVHTVVHPGNYTDQEPHPCEEL